MPWDSETGDYRAPEQTWKVTETDVPEGAPGIWLSRPGGDHLLGMSFHSAPHNFGRGVGVIDDHYSYCVAPYLLSATQDQFNSWNVSARLKSHCSFGAMEHWEWLPGVLIVDTSTRYTLPDTALAAFAGCEWSDNDPRVFYGVLDLDSYDSLVRKFLELVNRLTGPGWAGWPFGRRQLSCALTVWISPGAALPDPVLLASVGQFGVKHAHLDARLYHPGERLGAWQDKPGCWDCRQAIRFLYQAKLMLADGLAEMAISTGIASMENACVEILKHLLKGDTRRAEKEVRSLTFLHRFDQLLPGHGVSLPPTLFKALKQAYRARNGVIHSLRPMSLEDAEMHLRSIEEAIAWYLQKLGGSSS